MFDMLYNFWTLNVELVFAIFIKNLRISVKKYPYFISLNLYNIPGKVSGYCAVPFFFNTKPPFCSNRKKEEEEDLGRDLD